MHSQGYKCKQAFESSFCIKRILNADSNKNVLFMGTSPDSNVQHDRAIAECTLNVRIRAVLLVFFPSQKRRTTHGNDAAVSRSNSTMYACVYGRGTYFMATLGACTCTFSRELQQCIFVLFPPEQPLFTVNVCAVFFFFSLFFVPFAEQEESVLIAN